MAALVGNLPNFYQQGATVIVILSVAQPVFIGADQTALYNATLLVTKDKSLSYDSSSPGMLNPIYLAPLSPLSLPFLPAHVHSAIPFAPLSPLPVLFPSHFPPSRRLISPCFRHLDLLPPFTLPLLASHSTPSSLWRLHFSVLFWFPSPTSLEIPTMNPESYVTPKFTIPCSHVSGCYDRTMLTTLHMPKRSGILQVYVFSLPGFVRLAEFA